MKAKRVALLFVFFSIGFAAIVDQVVLTREFLVVLSGNELCIGLILASWLSGIGAGAWLGAMVSDRIRTLVVWFVLGIAALAVSLPIQIIMIRSAYGFVGITRGEEIPLLSMLLFCPLVTAPSSLLVGFLFPLAGRLSADVEGKAVAGVAGLYIAESAGSLAGGLVFTFFLVETLLPVQVAILNAAVLAVGVFALAQNFSGKFVRNVIAGAAVAVVAFAGISIPDAAVAWDKELELIRWHQKVGPDFQLSAAADSKYQHLTVCRHETSVTLYTNGQQAGGFDPGDFFPVLQANFILGRHPSPKHILIIGTGTEAFLPAILESPVEKIDYALLDDKVLQLLEPYKSREHIEALRSGKLNLKIGDSRNFLQASTARYDMIIVMTPPPSTAMLNRYYTYEFFEAVKNHLEPGGVFAVPITMPPNYIGGIAGRFSASVSQALRRLFPEIVYTYENGDMVFCAAQPGIITTETEELKRRWRSRGIDEPFIRYFEDTWLQRDRLARRRAEVEALPPAGLNSDLQPTAYLYRLLVWNRTTGETKESADAVNDFILSLRDYSIWPPALVILSCLAVILVIRRLRGRRMPRLVSLAVIATTGFTVMALEILLIFAYQNLFGYVYHEIGLIVSVFMAGLAAGAWVAKKADAKNIWPARVRLLAAEAGIILTCIAFPLLVLFAGPLLSGNPMGRFVFIGILGFAGFLTGAQFPLALSMYLEAGADKVGAGAGAVDSADHLGAAGGAALAGVILAPVFGIWLSAVILILLKAASAVLVIRD